MSTRGLESERSTSRPIGSVPAAAVDDRGLLERARRASESALTGLFGLGVINYGGPSPQGGDGASQLGDLETTLARKQREAAKAQARSQELAKAVGIAEEAAADMGALSDSANAAVNSVQKPNDKTNIGSPEVDPEGVNRERVVLTGPGQVDSPGGPGKGVEVVGTWAVPIDPVSRSGVSGSPREIASEAHAANSAESHMPADLRQKYGISAVSVQNVSASATSPYSFVVVNPSYIHSKAKAAAIAGASARLAAQAAQRKAASRQHDVGDAEHAIHEAEGRKIAK